MNQVLIVFQQNLSDFESVGYVALPDKIISADNGGAAFPNILRARQPVQNIARFIE